MLTVEHYELIRCRVLVEGLSQRATAKERGHSRKTVAKALAYRIPPGYRLSEPRPRPVLDPVKGIIDAWLEQNAKAPVKQRQTAQRIYERLRDEYGFTGQGKTVGELFEEEKSCLLPRQSERFSACCRRYTFVDSHALVRVDNVRYSVPVRWAYHPCTIEIFVDRVRILCDHQVGAVHERCYIAGQFVLDPLHYLTLRRTKPGSLDNARPFKGQPWGESFDLMRSELAYRYCQDGTLRYIQVLMRFTKYPPEEVQAAVELCVRRRAFSPDAVVNVLNHEPLSPRGRLDLSDRPDLITASDGIRDTGIYDQLKAREAVLA